MPSGYPCFQERSSCINIESNFPYQSQYTKYGKKNTSTQVRCHETLSLSQKQKRKHNFKKRAIDVFVYHLHSFQQENRKLKKCKFCYGRCGSDKKPIEKSRLASLSHFCTLRIIWSAGLVTIPIMRAREHYL